METNLVFPLENDDKKSQVTRALLKGHLAGCPQEVQPGECPPHKLYLGKRHLMAKLLPTLQSSSYCSAGSRSSNGCG